MSIIPDQTLTKGATEYSGWSQFFVRGGAAPFRFVVTCSADGDNAALSTSDVLIDVSAEDSFELEDCSCSLGARVGLRLHEDAVVSQSSLVAIKLIDGCGGTAVRMFAVTVVGELASSSQSKAGQLKSMLAACAQTHRALR
jgi:hypothetical protein